MAGEKIHLKGRNVFIIIICNSNDATKLHTQEMQWRLGQQIYKITRKKLINLYTWTTSSCLQKWKKNGDSDTNDKNIQPGYGNGICHRKLCHAHNRKWKKKNNGRNRTAKSGKNLNALSETNLQVLRNIGSGYHQTSGDERKIKKKPFLRRTRKLLETKVCNRNLIKKIKTRPVPLVRYSGPF